MAEVVGKVAADGRCVAPAQVSRERARWSGSSWSAWGWPAAPRRTGSPDSPKLNVTSFLLSSGSRLAGLNAAMASATTCRFSTLLLLTPVWYQFLNVIWSPLLASRIKSRPGLLELQVAVGKSAAQAQGVVRADARVDECRRRRPC